MKNFALIIITLIMIAISGYGGYIFSSDQITVSRSSRIKSPSESYDKSIYVVVANEIESKVEEFTNGKFDVSVYIVPEETGISIRMVDLSKSEFWDSDAPDKIKEWIFLRFDELQKSKMSNL